MRADAARADRDEAIRQAARDWHRAGILSDEGLKGVEDLYPDDRVRVGPVMRILLFIFTLVGVYGVGGFVFALMESANGFEEGAFALVSLIAALLAVAATEIQIGRGRRAQGGTEAATSFAALTLFLLAVGLWLFEALEGKDEQGLAFFFLIGAAAFLAAAWHWGYALYGAIAAVGLLAGIAYLPLTGGKESAEGYVLAVRISWIVLGILAIALLPRVADSRRLPPEQRDLATSALLVFLAGLYLAVEISSFTGYWLEALALLHFSGTPPPPPPGFLRALSMAATVLVPAGCIVWGLLGRRRPVLFLGMILAGCAAISMRRFIHLAPLWVVLTVAGALLLALALLVRRALDRAPNGEWRGLTAEPPLEGQERARLVELIAATAQFTPAARELPSEPTFQGKGGELGGGGSTSDF